MRRLILLLALATAASAQALVPSLIEYLDLTAAQITRLRQNAAEYNRFYTEKALRYQQVHRELVEEYARDVVDPLALGQRYVEQEAICRELRSAYQQNFDRNQTVLTAAQRTRISALDTVVTNSNLARAAAAQNLLELPTGTAFPQFSFTGQFGLAIPPGLSNSAGGLCGLPTVNANPVLMSREAQKGSAK